MDARLTIAYRGDRYAGWQRQDNAPTVQQLVEEALEDLVAEPVRTVGAGRTDAGVHARGQVVSFSLGRDWPPGALVHGTNSRLPGDVRVLAARSAVPGFDARRHALAKDYRYRLVPSPVLSPLEAPFAVRVEKDLDLAAMIRATRSLPGRHDLSAFANAGGSHRDPRRTVFRAEWRREGDGLVFRVVGDGFLRGTVRILVGTLLEVGRGRRDIGSVAELLSGGDRAVAGPTAPPQGLVLHRVFYPEDRGGPSLDRGLRAVW